MDIPTITVQALNQLRQSGRPVRLIDVRTPAEYREVHVDFAVNVPLDKISPETIRQQVNGDPNEPIYFICRSGSRSNQACQKLRNLGLTNVVTVEGGTLAWIEAGLPVVRGKKAISLERQVRIAAGSLVLLGVVLGWLVHPAFYGLSAFIGAGLVFSGVTDTCGMAMILAKMPWNQAGQSGKSQKTSSASGSSSCSSTPEPAARTTCCG
ncbi:MAG: sulfurtransferase [Pirellulaceae bacterium]|nr:MAG: sulfurtransferase [Pirellulaceae bacterium]